jgi:hypothetical protein
VRIIERRSTRQQNPEMELQYSYRRRGLTCIGTGRIRYLNAAEVAFEPDKELPDDGQMELQIQWPFLLQGVCPLELLVVGKVTCSDARKTVVYIERYEFRTCGEHSFEPAIAKGIACDLVA